MVMTRVFFAAALLVAGLSGCAQVKEVSYDPTTGSGVVAIPSDAGIFDGMNRRAAKALIEKRVGPHFDIVDEKEFAIGQQTLNNQQVNGTQTTGQTTTQNLTEWRIAYRKTTVGSMLDARQGGSIQQTRYMQGSGSGVQPAGGIVPDVRPGVNHAGGACADGNCSLPRQ
jgi:hypothetical protein